MKTKIRNKRNDAKILFLIIALILNLILLNFAFAENFTGGTGTNSSTNISVTAGTTIPSISTSTGASATITRTGTSGTWKFNGSETGASVNPQTTNPSSYLSYDFTSPNAVTNFNAENCFARQDVLLSIVPGGCSPNVIRSDLLEEQNVPVFCKLMSFQVNPLIDISRVRSISFRGQYPKGITSVSYFPARAALKKAPSFEKSITSSPVNTDLGYLVVVVARNPVEKNMPEFIQGNITAVIQYDSEGVWGVGKSNFYVSEMNDQDWMRDYKDYGFWNGKAYVRADSVENDRAIISVYRDSDSKQSTVSLKEGETSKDIYLGGFYCAAGLNIKLNSVDVPVDSALLQINDEQIWVSKGDKIIDNKCSVAKIDVYSGGGKISLNCPVKDGKVELSLNPGKATLRTGEISKEYGVGELVDSNRNIYLVYLGQDINDKRYAVFVKDSLSGTSADFADKELTSAIKSVAENKKSSVKELENEIKKAITSQYKKKLQNTPQKEIDEKIKVEIVSEGKSGFEIDLDEISIAKDKERVLENLPSQEAVALDYYNKAIKAYEDLHELYSGERRIPEDDLYAAIGLYQAAMLSKRFGMDAKAQEFYNKILKEYPDTNIARRVKSESDLLKKYDTRNSKATITINNQQYFINLLDFKKPKKEERSAVFWIDGKEETLELNQARTLVKGNETGGVSKSIKINEIKKDYVMISYDKSFESKTDSRTVRLGLEKENQAALDGIEIKLLKINLKKQAKIEIIPKAFGPRAESTFNFGVGIEKRAIQLTPEQAKDMMSNLLEVMKTLNDINAKLGKVIQAMKAACFITAGVLTIKNTFSGMSGESIARNRIMTSAGGWNQYCEKLVNEKQFQTVQQCLMNKASEIEKDVKSYGDSIKSTNNIIKDIEKEVGKDNKKIEEKFKDRFNDFCKSAQGDVTLPDKESTKIPFQGENGICSWKNLTFDQMRDIYTVYNARSSGSEVMKNVADKELGKTVLDAKTTEEYNSAVLKSDEEARKNNIGISTIIPAGDSIAHGEIKRITKGDKQNPIYKNFNEGDAVVRVFIPNKKGFGNIAFSAHPNVAGKDVIVQVKEVGGEKGVYSPGGKVYTLDGKEVAGEALKSVRDYMSLAGMDKIKQGDEKAYKNPMKDPGKLFVKYFETAPYKGLPSEVPFDVNEGWYAELTYVLSGFGRPYDESGRPINFYVCNVGANGLIEFKKSADDICRYYNAETGADVSFPGLNAAESRRLVQKAEQAILDAAKQYGKQKVTINGRTFNSGKSFGGEGGKCSDFMSPSDCSILFNVCDPVICPASRCDLGGKYRVDNVIQTGVIGSLTLCLPNFREGVMIPLCLTGVHAGLEGYISILNSSVQCLNESITTGRNVGICDEIKSIYICEFFWKQAAPFASTIMPGIFEGFYGQGRGGGEYSSVKGAWDNTKGAVNWFTNEYAINSMQAFNRRSIEGAGTEVCKAFISSSFSGSKSFFERLIEPDSPVQYHAWFSEDTMTTATVPPASHYKVYYHIYAGKDFGSYFYIYLKDLPGKSGVFSSDYYSIERGYVPRAGQADQARDFIAPSGFRQLCININGKDECGFGKVSSSYLINSFSDAYAKEQAKERISSEKECIAGTPSAYSLIQPNLQAGIESVINPQIYKSGIIRVCSSENPGKQVLPSGQYDTTNSTYDRWKDVGYCDDSKIRCWLDTNSVKDVIKDKGIKEEVLKSADTSVLGQDNSMSYEESISAANSAEREIEELVIEYGDSRAAISSKINETVAKLVKVSNLGASNVHRARALYLIGKLYQKIAEELLKIKISPGSEINPVSVKGTEKESVKKETKTDYQKVYWSDFKNMTREDGTLILKASIFENGEAKDYYVLDFNEETQEILLTGNIRKRVAKDSEGRIVFAGSEISGKLETSDSGEITLEYADGAYSKNIYYKFNENSEKWLYSMDKGKNWKAIIEAEGDEELSEKNLIFIRNLKDKKCNDGLKSMIARVLKNDEGGWFADAALIVHYQEKSRTLKYNNPEDGKCANLKKLFE